MRLNKIFQRTEDEGHNFWMSYTDLMSGFLVVFIIISAVMYNRFNNQKKKYEDLCYILQVENPDSLKSHIDSLKDRIKSLEEHSNLKNRIYEYGEIFKSTEDIEASIDTIRGSIILKHKDSSKDLFTPGDWTIKPPLKEYLHERYAKIVQKTMQINKDNNVELRIEGHTDPTWKGSGRGDNYSFLKNLDLSSKRANAVYEYIVNGSDLSYEEKEFVKMNMISIGYSFSCRVQEGTLYDESCDPSSRRIEFRILSK